MKTFKNIWNKTQMFLLAFIVGSVALAGVSSLQNTLYAKAPEAVSDEDLLTYVSELDPIENGGLEMTQDEEGVYTMTANEGERVTVLQLTDTHISGIEENHDKDIKAINAIYTLVERTRPDFIVVTGDAIFGMPYSDGDDDTLALQTLLALMDQIGIPWTWTFGNHDHSFFDRYSTDEIAEMLSQSSTLCMYDKNEDISGYSNGVFKLCNADGSISQLLIMIDSNGTEYGDEDTGEVTDYEPIYEDQVDWYQDQIEKYSCQQGQLVSSMVFFHIPIQEYVDAWNSYEENNYSTYYYFGDKREESSCSSMHSSLFERALELGSTKAMFCGHDHRNDYALNYEGIDLVYGKSIDYTAYPGIEYETEQRGATVISIGEDGNYTLSTLRLQ